VYFGVFGKVECVRYRSFLVENQKRSNFDVVESIACIPARSLTSPVKTLSSSWPSGNIVEILYQLSRSCSGVNASADSFVRSALISPPNFDVSFNRTRATGSKHAYRHRAMLLVELRDLRLLDPW
jgi:hypothetical protein